MGNIGNVYRGNSRRFAAEAFDAYVGCSKSPHGSASGESVVWIADGEIHKEFDPGAPPPIPEKSKASFNALAKAFSGSRAVLVPAVRKADKSPAFLVCAVRRDGSRKPVAVLVDDPGLFELFEEPRP